MYGKPTVLLIEDDALTARVVRKFLPAETVELVTATDGETGLKLAKAQTPHLIICDMHLPGISGQEVLLQLVRKAKTKNIPVLFVTGDRDRELLREVHELPQQLLFVSKPFSEDELRDAVEELLGPVF